VKASSSSIVSPDEISRPCDQRPKKGAVYVATGLRYVEEAAVSAVSLRRHMPGLPICLWTDCKEGIPAVFDHVLQLDEVRHNCHDKVPPLLRSPFEKTLFLDTDTYVCAPLDDLFQLLDRFDLLICHTPFRDPNPIPGIPPCFTEFNSGLFAFRNNSAIEALFTRWLEAYAFMGHRADQPALRQALWEDRQVRVYHLPPEYNFRTIFPGFIGGGSKVKVIHGRHRNWKKVETLLNRSQQARVVLINPMQRWDGSLVCLMGWGGWLRMQMGKLARRCLP
jgi:hypothetical protein